MYQNTEEEYAYRFCLLIILDKEKIAGMEGLKENFKYVLTGFNKIKRNNPGIILDEPHLSQLNGKDRELLLKQIEMLRRMCLNQKIEMIMNQPGKMYASMFSLLAEALHRTMILVRYYAPDGDMLADIMEKLYFQEKCSTETQLSREMSVSKATFYRRKQKAFMYAGYLFYQAVLPEMEGKI